jgi:hypothetical protein
MISNANGTIVLSSLGWVDGDALWVFDAASGRAETMPLKTGARYSSLHHAAGAERFAVGHHFAGARFELSVRTFADPSRVEARAVVSDRERTLTGDAAVWRDVPRLFVEYLAFSPWADFALISVSPLGEALSLQRFDWFDDSYDKAYQGITGVLRLPADDLALVSVQRSSRLVLHDLETGKARRFIDLAGRGGNPLLAFRHGGAELWATDYDTLVVLDAHDWQILRSARLQDAHAGTGQFIGHFAFATDGTCVVARPFSGDVVSVGGARLEIERSARLGQQPLEVAALPAGRVVARDWKTGALLRGVLA